MPLKRPVTLPQARRWPAAAKRRQSFCARMGGMRELLTGERAARDPASPINRALADWDCDEPELLQRKHVSKGIRMRVTSSKVGSESRKGPRKNPLPKSYPVRQSMREESDVDPVDEFVLKHIRKGMTTREILQLRKDARDMFLGGMEMPTGGLSAEAEARLSDREFLDWIEGFRGNPARKTAAPATLYIVHRADSQGKPTYDIAMFRKRSEALEYARAYAKRYDIPVVLTSRDL